MPVKKRKKLARRGKRNQGSPPSNDKGHWGKTRLEEERLRRQFEKVPLSLLRPWEDNPRINEDAIPRLAELIAEHGFAGVIIATPDGVIRAGHTRYAAVKRLGWDKIPVEWKNFPSVEAAEAYALSDNKSGEWADWDHAKLAKMFKNRVTADLERLSGFQKNQIDWGGRAPIDPDTIEEQDEDEVYTIRVEEIKPKDAKLLFAQIKVVLTQYKGGDYEAFLS